MEPNYDTFSPSGSTITERQRRNRKLLTIIGIAVIALGVGGWFLADFLNKKVVTLQPANGVTMAFGEPSHGEDAADIAKELAKTSNVPKEVRVKPGYYAVIYTGKGIKQTRQLVEVKKDMTITAPTPTYTDERLLAILRDEQQAIRSALNNNEKTKGYTPKGELLYENGTWYAAKLVPADPITQDTLVVIMQKQNGTWQVAAGPAITLYINDYPRVSEDIIRDINNRPLD